MTTELSRATDAGVSAAAAADKGAGLVEGLDGFKGLEGLD